MKVGFLGLGVMGFPMAGHLSKAGYNVSVYNRTFSKAEDWLKIYKGQAFKSPKEICDHVDVVLTCLGNDEDVTEVYTHKEFGLLSAKSISSKIFVDHTTTSSALATFLSEKIQTQNGSFMDAPVSGGESGAQNGSLTIMIGGEETTFAKVHPVLNSYAKAISLLGPVGSGQTCKMVNQIAISGVLQGLSEAVTFCQKSGLDIEKVVETLKHGAAGSWQLENRAVNMANDKFDYGFAIDWMVKDLTYCLQKANDLNVSLPLTTEVLEKYKSLQNENQGRMDTSVLIKQF